MPDRVSSISCASSETNSSRPGGRCVASLDVNSKARSRVPISHALNVEECPMPDNRDPNGLVSDATVAEEDREGRARSQASAARVERPYRDMTERGAHVQGAGQI